MTDQDKLDITAPGFPAVEAPKPEQFDIEGVPYVVTPPGFTLHNLEETLDQPIRVNERIVLTDLNSFIEYVNRYKWPVSIITAKATTGRLSFTCTIDYHDPDGEGGFYPAELAGWCKFSAEFTAQPTPAWNAWTQSNNKEMRQAEFSDFIYLNQADIVEPAGAELLEIIQSLKATAKGEFRDMQNLHTGSIELVYSMKVSASGGTHDRPLTLPETITIRLVPFFGCPEMELKADLVLRAPREDGAPVTMGYRIYRLEEQLQIMANEAIEDVREKTKLPVFIC